MKERRARFPFVGVILVLLLIAAGATAQVQTGSIVGTVVDPQGAVVVGAAVTVRDNSTSAEYKTTTDNSGAFTVAGLPFGDYRITIEVSGFKKWVATNVQVITAQQSVVRAQLVLGEVTEVVNVEAATDVIQTSTAELNTDVSRRQILDLPLVVRNPVELVTLQPGVNVTTGTREAVISGLRGHANNITQDGINIQDNFLRDDGLFAQGAPSVENTGEFSITSQNVGADSGFGVAQIRLTTPRGSNQFHGSLFYFHRNDALNANSFTNNLLGKNPDGTNVAPTPREREHRFGGRVGGPIYLPWLYNGRERTFFFFRYEVFREHETSSFNRTVLTSEARQGLFRYTGTNGQLQTVNLRTASGNPFPLNSFTTRFINASPLPNNTLVGDGFNTAGFTFEIPRAIPNDNYTLRFDHKLVQSQGWGTHWVEVVWNRQDNTVTEDFLNGTEKVWLPSVVSECVDGMCIGKGQFPRRRQLAVALHSSIGTSIVNEVRFGFFRPNSAFTRQAPFPRSFRVDFPTISDPEENSLDSGRFTPNYALLENFTKVWGRHTFRAGAAFHSVSSKPFSDGGLIPLVTLGSNTSNNDGLATSDFPFLPSGAAGTALLGRARGIYQGLVGLLGSITQTFNAFPGSGFVPGASDSNFYRERAQAFYFSDQWRLRSNFTLTLGLRYELIHPVQEVGSRALQPPNRARDLFISGPLFTPQATPTFADLRSGAAGTELVVSGSSDNPFWNTDKNNFAPSVGIAWLPWSKTVIRTGFGISYARDGLSVVDNAVGSNTGLVTTVTNSLPTGALDPSANFNLTPPPFSPTVSQLLNAQVTSGTAGIFTFDANLRTPYVMQWSFGIQHELWPTTAVEIRYVGNRAIKLYRGIDLNQIDVFSNTLATEFQAAQNNLALCRASRVACTGSATGTLRYDFRSAVPGSVHLPILEAMQVPSGTYTSSSRITNLDNKELGEWAHQVVVDCFNRFFNNNPAGSCPGLASFPANFFRANPLGFFGDVIGNHSQSAYDSLQIEFRRRMSGGLLIQANYTLGKVLTDSSGSASEFDDIMDLRNRRYERTRASFDVRHGFNFNTVWEVPVGRGQRYASKIPALSRILQNWQVGGIWRWRSGRPVRIVSARGTLNRAGRSANNGAVLLSGLAPQDICKFVGVHKTSRGVFWLPEEFFVRGSGTNTLTGNFTIFGNPSAGQVGSHQLVNGCSAPGYINVDINLIKRIPITEKANFEFRAEFFNIFNHPNFLPGFANNINSAGFASLNSSGNEFGSREIQFNFRINW